VLFSPHREVGFTFADQSRFCFYALSTDIVKVNTKPATVSETLGFWALPIVWGSK
jgi:hypothetical protein